MNLPTLLHRTFTHRIVFLIGGLGLGLGFRVQAHPGHGLTVPDPSHWVTSPDHVGQLAALGLGFWALGRGLAPGRSRRWVQVAGLCFTCSAGVVWGLGR